MSGNLNTLKCRLQKIFKIAPQIAPHLKIKTLTHYISNGYYSAEEERTERKETVRWTVLATGLVAGWLPTTQKKTA